MALCEALRRGGIGDREKRAKKPPLAEAENGKRPGPAEASLPEGARCQKTSEFLAAPIL